MTARDALLQLCDQSNWPDDLRGEAFHAYTEAMDQVHQVVMDFWPELTAKVQPSIKDRSSDMPERPLTEIAAELATFREFCTCTEDNEDPQCDGTRCMGQQRAIEAALRDAAKQS